MTVGLLGRGREREVGSEGDEEGGEEGGNTGEDAQPAVEAKDGLRVASGKAKKEQKEVGGGVESDAFPSAGNAERRRGGVFAHHPLILLHKDDLGPLPTGQQTHPLPRLPLLGRLLLEIVPRFPHCPHPLERLGVFL